MWLTTVASELKNLIADNDADVIVITETKLKKTNCNSKRVKTIFSDYTLFYSCNAPKKTPYNKHAREHLGRGGSGGVTLAVKNVSCGAGSACRMDTSNKEAFLTSHCVGVRLQPPHCDPLLIWGIYMPFVHSHRKNIQSHLMEEMSETSYHILAGGWNAGLFDRDRPPEYDEESETFNRPGADSLHSDFVSTAKLKAVDDPSQSQKRTLPSNREDAVDVLLSKDLYTGDERLEFPESNGDSDHGPVIATVFMQILTLIMPPPLLPERIVRPRIKTPFNPDDLANFKTQVSLQIG